MAPGPGVQVTPAAVLPAKISVCLPAGVFQRHLPAPETWTPAHSGGHLEPKLRATDKITTEFEPNALVEEKNLCGAAARRAGGSSREHLSDFVPENQSVWRPADQKPRQNSSTKNTRTCIVKKIF